MLPAIETARSEASRLHVRSQRQLAMLTVQFLLGMAVNLMGTPSNGTLGAARSAYYVLIAAHVLVGLALLAGAVLTIGRATRGGPAAGHLAWLGGVSVAVAFVAGIATGVVTMITPGAVLGGDLLSYLMAAGFIAAFIFYGALYQRTSV